MDDGRNQSGFSATCSCTQGFTKRASIPLATTESRWWESGALGGRNRAMAGEKAREREGGWKRWRRSGGRMRKQLQANSSPVEKNKWLEGSMCFSHPALPVSPGRTDSWHTRDGMRQTVRTILREKDKEWRIKKTMVKEKRRGRVQKSTNRRQQ